MVCFEKLSLLALAVMVGTTVSAPASLDVDSLSLEKRQQGPVYPNSGPNVYWSTFAGGPTACGKRYNGNAANNQLLAAVPARFIQGGAKCDKQIEVVFNNNQKVNLTVVDTCLDCTLLVSLRAFNMANPGTAGRIPARWRFV